MGNTLTKGTMFPVELTNEMFNLVKGHSSLAKLAASEPVPFNGKEVFTFSLDSEIDIVAENGAKSNGGATVAPVSIVPIKVEYGTRVSDEFMYASDEDRLPILRTFAEGFSRKLARGIDIMAMHGVNPRTGSASDLIGNNCFDKKVTQKVTFNSSTPDANIEDAIALVNGNEEEVTGMAYAPAMKAALAAEVTTGGAKKYPELAWGGNPDTINGLAVDANATVSAALSLAISASISSGASQRRSPFRLSSTAILTIPMQATLRATTRYIFVQKHISDGASSRLTLLQE